MMRFNFSAGVLKILLFLVTLSRFLEPLNKSSSMILSKKKEPNSKFRSYKVSTKSFCKNIRSRGPR